MLEERVATPKTPEIDADDLDPSKKEVKEEKKEVTEDGKPKPKQVFSVRRMLPPGTVNYYYTINEEKITYNKSEPAVDSDQLLHGGL